MFTHDCGLEFGPAFGGMDYSTDLNVWRLPMCSTKVGILNFSWSIKNTVTMFTVGCCARLPSVSASLGFPRPLAKPYSICCSENPHVALCQKF